MSYDYEVYEVDGKTQRFIRSINAYCSRKRAEDAADRLTAEAVFLNTGKEYQVHERQ